MEKFLFKILLEEQKVFLQVLHLEQKLDQLLRFFFLINFEIKKKKKNFFFL